MKREKGQNIEFGGVVVCLIIIFLEYFIYRDKNMQVIVIASEKMYHCLSPFMHQWHKYANFRVGGNSPLTFDVTVCGFGHVIYYKASFTNFVSLGHQSDWPISRWSEKLLKILDEVADEQFILMLEDYWLTRPVDVRAVKMLFDYAKQFQNVLKIDLGSDRLYINGGVDFLYGANTYDNVGYLDLIKSPPGTPYQMSLWGGIWNREQLRKVLVHGESPQDIEIAGTSRVTDDQLVLGTRQAPLLHGNIYQSRNKGEPVYEDAHWAIPLNDMAFMRKERWIE